MTAFKDFAKSYAWTYTSIPNHVCSIHWTGSTRHRTKPLVLSLEKLLMAVNIGLQKPLKALLKQRGWDSIWIAMTRVEPIGTTFGRSRQQSNNTSCRTSWNHKKRPLGSHPRGPVPSFDAPSPSLR